MAVVLIGAGAYMMMSRGGSEPTDTQNAPNAKIDINAVCEGALAYMTFTDGAAAATFVAECKEGKHPEVIEKFRKDTGLDGAVI